MNSTLVLLGVVCVIAAVVGGGLKALGVELPAIQSVRRQIVLGLLGLGLVGLGSINPNLTTLPTITTSPAVDGNESANPVSNADINIVPQPEAVRGMEIAGYSGKYASVDYLIQVQGEDVNFVSLDTEFRHMDGSSVLPKTFNGRFLGGNFKVRAGKSHEYLDNIPTDGPCSKANAADNGSIDLDYTFNAVDSHKIPIAPHAIVRIAC